MAFSRRWKLMTAAAVAALALGACGGGGGGEGKGDGDDGGPSRMDGATGGSTGGGDAGFVVPIADLDDHVAGKPCMVDGDCPGTAGSCAFGACTGTCENNGNCGAGGSCVKAISGALGQYGACAKTCTVKTDCGEGQDCREGIQAGDLFSDLVGAAQDAGLALNGQDAGIDIDVTNLPKTCGPALATVDLPDGIVGNPCTMAAQCAPGECTTNVNGLERFPNGYCTGGCASDDQCGAGGVCYKDPATAFLKLEGRCLLGCASVSDCRSGQVCRASQILFDSKTYCLAPVPDAGVPGSDAGGSDAGAADAGAADAGHADGG